MRPGITRPRQILLATAGFILAAGLVLPFVLNHIVNTPYAKSQLSQRIETLAGIAIEPENTQLILAPVPGIRFLNFEYILDHQFVLTAQSIKLELDLLKTLTGKPSIRHIEVLSPDFQYLSGFQAAPAQIPEHTIPKQGAPNENAALDPKLVFQALDHIFDLLPDTQGNFNIRVSQARTPYFEQMNADLAVKIKNRTFSLSSHIQGLHLFMDLLPEFKGKSHLPFDVLKTGDIHLDITGNTRGELHSILKTSAFELFSPRLLSPIHTGPLFMDLSLSPTEITAQLQPADFNFPQLTAGVSFSHELTTGHTRLFFTGSDVHIDQARQICLPLLQGIEVSDILFDILQDGIASQVSVGFESQGLYELFDVEHLIISGSAAQAKVKIPEVDLMVDQIRAEVTMDKGILHIEPQSAQVSSAQLTGGVLDIDLSHPQDVGFAGKFELDALLDQLPDTLIYLLPDTELALELARIKAISGKASAVLELDFPRQTQELAVKVDARNITARAEYDRIPLPLDIGAGQFIFTPEAIQVNQVSGRIGHSPFQQINAHILLPRSAATDPSLSLTGKAVSLNLGDVMAWIRTQPQIEAFMAPADSLSGHLMVDELQIKGPLFTPQNWQYTAHGSGDAVVLGFENHPNAVQNLAGRFSLNQDRIHTDQISCKLMDIGWLDFAAPPKSLDSIRVPIQVSQASIVHENHKAHIQGQLTSPAGPFAAFSLSGSSLETLFPSKLHLKDPELTDVQLAPNLDTLGPLLSFEGHLNTLTLEKLLVKDSFLDKKIKKLTAGDPIEISTDANGQIHVKTQVLNLDGFLMRNDPQISEQTDYATHTQRPFLAQKILFFNADQVIYKGIEFNTVDARLWFTHQTTRVDIQNASFCDLDGSGKVEIIHGRSTDNITTDFRFEAKAREDVNQTIGCLTGAPTFIEGPYSAVIDLEGTGSVEKIQERQSGKLQFHSHNGRIYKATLLSRVLSVINLLGSTDITQQGFGYKSLDIEAHVKDSRIFLEKAVIDGENMAIIANGWLDPLQDELSVTFLVAPFKTVDTIIQHIPIVNTILKGRLVSVPAKASGKISNPTVIPLHPAAVGKGLVGLLTDIVKAPVRLIEELPKGPDFSTDEEPVKNAP